MTDVVISGSAVWNPPHVLTNEELVGAYNGYAEQFNAQNADAIAAGDVDAVPTSSAEFIQKASGIKQRYIYCKDGVLDINRMRPIIPERGEDELSHQAEYRSSARRPPLVQSTTQSSS